WEEIRPGGYDPEARLKDIAEDGVEAEVLYPSVGMGFFSLDDTKFQVALMAAYNTWIAEFWKAHPDRFKGLALVPIDDPEWAAAEAHRAKDLGLAGLMSALYPFEDADEEEYG